MMQVDYNILAPLYFDWSKLWCVKPGLFEGLWNHLTPSNTISLTPGRWILLLLDIDWFGVACSHLTCCIVFLSLCFSTSGVRWLGLAGYHCGEGLIVVVEIALLFLGKYFGDTRVHLTRWLVWSLSSPDIITDAVCSFDLYLVMRRLGASSVLETYCITDDVRKRWFRRLFHFWSFHTGDL